METSELKIKRTYFANTYTIGKLYVDGQYFCDTLEDTVRVLRSIQDKIPGKTAIPAGKYIVKVNRSPKFKRLLPRLYYVPFFEGILIHRGNEDKDTNGCILVGENKVKGRVINSTIYEEKLVELLKDKTKITIEIS